MNLVAVKDVQKGIASLYNDPGSKRKENKVLAASTRLDKATQRYIEMAVETHQQIEADRAARLQDNRRLEQLLKKSEEDRDVRLKANQQLVRELKESEEDRAARLEDNRRLEQLLKKSEEDRDVRLKANQQLVRELKESEEDRAARLEDNRRLEQLLKESEADRAARLEIIHKLESRLKGSEESEERARTNLEALKENKIVRFLIRLGLVSHGKKLGQPKGETGEEES